VKLILAGPPHSGKSCLRAGLKSAIVAEGGIYPYFITACPDGEGAWYRPTVAQDPELAYQLKVENRGDFTPAFVERLTLSVRHCSHPLSIFDLGGRVSDENRLICAAATHAVLLYREAEQLAEWEAFCAELGIRVIARLRSDYTGASDTHHSTSNGVLEGSIHYLERGEPLETRPTIRQLAKWILNLSHAELNARIK